MTFLAIVGALCGPLVIVALCGFFVEAVGAFRDAPKSPPAAHPSMSLGELKALVRRHFEQTPVPDDSEQRLAAALLEGQS